MNAYKQVDNEVELCISPELEAEINKLFAEEIRTGKREVLPDGRLYFRFAISTEKAALLRQLSVSSSSLLHP